LLHLWHQLAGNLAWHQAWALLAHKAVNHVEYLVREAGLSHGSHACCQHQRPEHRHGYYAHGSYCRLVQPLLLPDHCQHAASSALNGHRERRLHADDGLKVATLFQLHHHLIFVADLLCLVALCHVDVHQVAGKPFDVYFFTVIKSCIHPLLSSFLDARYTDMIGE
jgi:hypothetical protein